MTDVAQFPPGFLWGAATSAYQIEGSPLADGAGPSNWHLFSHRDGTISDASNGDIACDHYRRFGEDIGLMRQLGLQAYRFSLSWSRIFPAGTGKINQKGLDFYRRLLNALLDAGIQPYPTLFHWDLPAALDERGGWTNSDCAHWLADYAQTVFGALGGLAENWTTLNEPWVIADAGFLDGIHAPGHRSLQETPLVAHNLLRAHALAVQAFRAESNGRIGIVVNIEPKYAASDQRGDQTAAERAHAYMNRQYLDPLFLGGYPDELAEVFGDYWPRHNEADMRLLRTPFDFLGVNYYTRSVNRADGNNLPVRASPVAQPGAEYTEMGWEVFPRGLKETLLWIKRRYGDIPLYVTENGAAFKDPPLTAQGRLHDARRVEYYRTHLNACREAIGSGVNLKGYFAWSLFDNFEWSYGYSKRFGLIHVDFDTQKRIFKDSAYFFSEAILSNGASIDSD
ncbi:beta-glucosidase [Candidatus Methylospira mobilis]|uniref:Beta-glucosidase n=1 Tax=Candidatus Methylospira mobilis TaxID=1808979 RepID=A0A5Q0BLR2_9GAMM|nr:GH1 family beta-glucosidase [Candidatus Methylospira mobilis]QFY44773.1 beta-glucosidase [Candidatus Methylospira mobilis]WNV05686.1 GH1 family beta-glucosidase [Candidatus Methylospira mobilis]